MILPDGGRAYLSKIFNDAWMASHGMLERQSDRTVGDVLHAKRAAGEIPPLVVVETRQRVRDAIALLHRHGVSQLPVVSQSDPTAVVGSIGERGLLKHAADDPGIMGTAIVDVMEPPFPAVAATDPVREAVELLSGDRQALLVTDGGRPAGHRDPRRPPGGARLVTEFATRVVHAGLTPDPAYGSVVPAIHQSSTYVQRAPGEFVEDYDYSRSANPTRRALEVALGELEGGHGSAFASGMAATHALLTAVCSAGDHVVIPTTCTAARTGSSTRCSRRWGLAYDMVDQRDLDAVRRAIRPETRLVWVETPTNPALNVIDVAGVIEAAGADALVAVDNTFATPVHQRPLELGAGAVVHSTTKYLGGHSDAVGGAVVVRDPALHEQVRFVQNAVGAVPGPLDCFLVHRGLRTLHLRMAAHAENGLAVCEWLREQPGVSDVRWPGLRRHGLLPPSRTPWRSCARRGSSRSPSRSAAWSRWSRSRRP